MHGQLITVADFCTVLYEILIKSPNDNNQHKDIVYILVRTYILSLGEVYLRYSVQRNKLIIKLADKIQHIQLHHTPEHSCKRKMPGVPEKKPNYRNFILAVKNGEKEQKGEICGSITTMLSSSFHHIPELSHAKLKWLGICCS